MPVGYCALRELTLKTMLYKYREFISKKPSDNISDDLNVKNLFNCEAWLSSRTQFNDPLDSHVNYQRPTVRSIRALLPLLNGEARNEAESWIRDGALTEKIMKHWGAMEREYNKVIDSYAMYCFASSPTNNLMWAHYANDHTGYCIEFNKSEFEATEVRYANKLYEIDASELIKLYFGLPSDIGKFIHRGLTTKLNDWRIEGERRHISQGKLPVGTVGMIKPYPAGAVCSLIFGAKIDPEKRQYLMDNIPYIVAFKQARVDHARSRVVIETYKKT